ncbi:hypothetical protein KJ575_02695 [Patescibacteria group bacterium]|nr:hypothetical protein [Patescibacteria group bacterium]
MMKYKQQKAKKSEINFSDFCKQRKIECTALDDSNNNLQRQKFLINPNGKCPDFWCQKNNQEIFVEVKTLTNITNAKREKQMDGEIKKGLKDGKKIIKLPDFNPIPELKGPLENFLKDASSQFKNIKEDYNFPKILLLCDVINSHFVCHTIFLGAYDSYSKVGGKLNYAGMRKKEQGLFDKTGLNVSALVFWNEEEKCFDCIANPRARIEFSESSFNLFFGR